MDQGTTSFSGVDPEIPSEGIIEATRSWSGRGELWASLATIDDSTINQDWDERDIEKRAHRVLFERLKPVLQKMPERSRDWIHALPAESKKQKRATPSPSANTDWRRTRFEGWPPRSFVTINRRRSANTLLVTALRWSLEQLKAIHNDAKSVVSKIDLEVEKELDALNSLVSFRNVQDADPIAPSQSDIRSLESEGYPWIHLARLASRIRRLDEDKTANLISHLILPSDDLKWRVFHLSVLGKLIIKLKDFFDVTSLRPISTSLGPSYKVSTVSSGKWDLWFEASGIWKYYDVESPYKNATKNAPFSSRPIGRDIMLVRPFSKAIIFECKYSKDVSVVLRGGYQQVLSYAVEAFDALVDKVSSAVVGPTGVVGSATGIQTSVGEVFMLNPDNVGDWAIHRF